MLLFDFYTVNVQSLDLFSLTNISNFSLAELDLINKTMILAQDVGSFSDIDIIEDIRAAWQEFVETGRIWAMLIGIFLGYAFRSFLP
jgi:hypothetical protein